jgi:hypothetical protein
MKLQKWIGMALAVALLLTTVTAAYAAEESTESSDTFQFLDSAMQYDDNGNAFKVTATSAKNGPLVSATTSFRIVNYSTATDLSGLETTSAVSSSSVTLSMDTDWFTRLMNAFNGDETAYTADAVVRTDDLVGSENVNEKDRGVYTGAYCYIKAVSGVYCTHTFTTNTGVSMTLVSVA